MALATCETYLLDEFVKPPFETWPPKLCQTHIWQDITHNIRSNKSLNESIISSCPKQFSYFCKMFWRKKHETLWGHISQKSSSRIFWADWLFPKNVPNISSDTIPLQSCWRYLPPIVLAEISLTPEYVQTGQFFLYTKQNLHQKIFTPKNFFTRRGFTPNSFYIKNLWYERVFTPEIFTTIGTLHQRFFHIYIYAYTRKLLHKKHSGLFLQQEPYTPKGFYTIGNLHQRAFTPRDSYSKRIAPNSFYAGQLLHQKTFTPELFTSQSF